MPVPIGIYRIIFENSIMCNNDEYVFYSPKPINFEEFYKEFRPKLTKGISEPRLVICRPVFEEEVKDGLKIHSGIFSCFDKLEEQNPPISFTLDGLYKFIDNVMKRYEFFNKESKNPTHIIENIIAQHFYDCLSGGMSVPMLVACRMAIKRFGCDLSTPVYPGREGENWYTLEDFMKETERHEKEEEKLLPYFNPNLLPEKF